MEFFKTMGRLIVGFIIMYGASFTATAAIIDFEDQSQAVGTEVTNHSIVFSGGYRFNSSPNPDHSHFANNLYGLDSGDTYLGMDDWDGSDSGVNRKYNMTKVGGGFFNVLSLDLAGWGWADEDDNAATKIRITTWSGTKEKSKHELTVGSFSTVVLNAMGIDRLRFDSIQGVNDGKRYYAVDNIVTSEVQFQQQSGSSVQR